VWFRHSLYGKIKERKEKKKENTRKKTEKKDADDL